MLDDLYFGKDDAETDIGRSGLLSRGFLETAAYKNAVDGRKWLILGRKGSGKSAISLMIMKSFGTEGRVSLVTPDEISAEEIKRFDLGGIAPILSKELLWRYIFAVQIIKLLLANMKRRKRPATKTKGLGDKLRQFLIDNGEADDLSSVERFWRVVERLKVTLKLSAFATEAAATLDLASGVRLSEQVHVIEKKILEFAMALKMECEQNSFYILVDQIERVWSNDLGSDALVAGLLQAGKYVQKQYEFVNCVVFLRIDIYEKLNFPERDKLRGDEFHIKWTRNDLIQLIKYRAEASTAKLSNGKYQNTIEGKSLWGNQFPDRMGETDIRKYLGARTLNRPRDIIQLCNACRDIA